MNAFTTHPSVRMRGTENNYEPVQCMAPQCANKVPHMHCPFCTKAESFVDPVILKAHYRVKHVDKGIDFAGLKVLRCCDHCDIVGTIKGAKEFKGAHWHCYRCKNGFNRRDEAIKHYRTHFRNPQTTFQIQITQEINQMYPMGHEVDSATETLAQHDLTTIHPALTEAVMTTTATELIPAQSETLPNGRTHDGEVHVSVAANETVDTSDGQTIMIIQEDTSDLDPNEEPTHHDTCTFQITNTAGGVELHGVEQPKLQQEDMTQKLGAQQADDVEQRLYDMQQCNEQLELEKQQLEHEVEQLKLQVQIANQDLTVYQKREQDLLAQLSIPLDERIHELLRQLKTDHEDLLHQQLAHLRKSYLRDQLATVTHHSDDQLTQNSIIIVTPDAGGGDATIRLTEGVEESEYVTTETTSDQIENDADHATVVLEQDSNEHDSSHLKPNANHLVDNNVTITLSTEQFERLENAQVHENTTDIIADEMEEPPEKRKRIT